MNNITLLITKIILLLPFFTKEAQNVEPLKNEEAVSKIEYVVNTKLVFRNFDGNYSMYFNTKQSYFYNASLAPEDTYVEDGNIVTAKEGDSDGFPIYKNLITNEMQQKYGAGKAANKCIIADKLTAIKWNITKETKKISTFNTKKAVGDFGGRTYEVWFTTDIAVSNGPFKLQGLPGMILEAKSLDGKVTISFKSYEQKSKGAVKKLSDFLKIPQFTHPEYLKKVEEAAKKRIIDAKAMGIDFTPPDPNNDWQIEKKYL